MKEEVMSEYRYFISTTIVRVEPYAEGLWKIGATMKQERSKDGENFEEKSVQIVDINPKLADASKNVQTEVEIIMHRCDGNLFNLPEEKRELVN